MSVRLTALGGAAAWPNQGQGCSAYLVRAGDTSVLLDCGPDTLHVLRSETDFTNLSGIVISHFHADHILDLVPFRYGLLYGRFDVERPIPLWLPPGGHDFLAGVARALGAPNEDPAAFWTGAFDIHEFEPGTDFTIADLTISTTPTQHFIDCYAIRVTASSGKVIAYTADTGTIEPLVSFAANADLLISEATLRDHGDVPLEDRGHITPQEAAELASLANVRALLVTHLWSERPDDEVLDAARRYDGPIKIAKPGLTIDV
jgi:ribonuclease BN (tRNA processing enzyme)